MSFEKIKIPSRGNKITMSDDGVLNVPDDPIIPYIEGDGIGQDIWPSTEKVINAAVKKAYPHKEIEWMEVYAGEKANQVYDSNIWLPDETLDLINEYLIAIKGPLTTPVGGGIRSPEAASVAVKAGADIIVTGTLVETSNKLKEEMSTLIKTIHSG